MRRLWKKIKKFFSKNKSVKKSKKTNVVKNVVKKETPITKIVVLDRQRIEELKARYYRYKMLNERSQYTLSSYQKLKSSLRDSPRPDKVNSRQ